MPPAVVFCCMSWAGLDAESMRARNGGALPPSPSLWTATAWGAVGFVIASLAVFGSVAVAERAIYRTLGVAGAYVLWTGMFMGLGGVLLGRLVPGPGNLRRFAGVFALGFALYGIGWCLGWFGVRRFWGEFLGTLLGAVLLHLVLVSAFGRMNLFLRTLLATVAANLEGYFLGEWIWRTLDRSPLGMTLWGVVYGLFVGGGIGWLLYRLQRPEKVP